MGFDTILPVALSAPHALGGLELKSDSIGYLVGVSSIFQLVMGFVSFNTIMRSVHHSRSKQTHVVQDAIYFVLLFIPHLHSVCACCFPLCSFVGCGINMCIPKFVVFLFRAARVSHSHSAFPRVCFQVGFHSCN